MLRDPDGARRRAWNHGLDSDQFGLLYFLGRDNAEVLVKVLGGQGPGRGRRGGLPALARCAARGRRLLPATERRFRHGLRSRRTVADSRRRVHGLQTLLPGFGRHPGGLHEVEPQRSYKKFWPLLGKELRKVPVGALVHDSVRLRLQEGGYDPAPLADWLKAKGEWGAGDFVA